MRSWFALSCVVAITVVGACSSSGDHEVDAHHLPNGLRVPPGSKLVGAVAPSILPSGDHTTGWSALLTITDDPARIYRDLARQTTRLGFPAMPAVRLACRSNYRGPSPTGAASGSSVVSTSHGHTERVPEGDVRCDGSTNQGDMTFGVTVAACPSCMPKVSAAVLQYRSFPKRPIRRTKLPTPVGHNRGPIPRSTWPVLEGTRVLAQADLTLCQGGLYTVLDVTGSPDDVWNRYLARYGSSTAFEPVTTAVEATVDGARVRQSLGGATGQTEVVTLVQRPGLAHPVLTVSQCSD